VETPDGALQLCRGGSCALTASCDVLIKCNYLRGAETFPKSPVVQLVQEISSLLWNPNVRCLVHKSTPLVPVLNQLSPVHTFSSYFPKIWSNIVSSSTLRSSKLSPSLQVFVPKFCMHFFSVFLIDVYRRCVFCWSGPVRGDISFLWRQVNPILCLWLSVVLLSKLCWVWTVIAQSV
jgi:hypothetical protein